MSLFRYKGDKMKIVVGLGNPGSEYSQTRHNVGFMAIDMWAEKHGVTAWKNKFEAQIAEIKIHNENIILVKPQTYMNLSGVAVREVVNWYKVKPEDVIVIYDDMDTTLGKIRLRKKGSSGGHNGIESILVNIGKEEFPRVRVGIGRPPSGWTVVGYVLGKFNQDEQPVVVDVINKIGLALDCWLKEGLDKAMNKFNK